MSESVAGTALYRLDLQYLGTAYQGWQTQPNGQGIQDIVERALATSLRHPVRAGAAARTDSGVHAEHQVVTFESNEPFDQERWQYSLQSILPRDIGVTAITPVAPGFHAIRSSLGKAYRYRLWCARRRNPFVDPFAMRIPVPIDLELIKREVQSFVGLHDFTSFCASGSSAKTRERRILEVGVASHGPLVEIWFVGEGFLKQMVRNMVGTLVHMAQGKMPGATISQLLQARDRRVSGPTAPACGLTLVQIFYDRVQTIKDLQNAARSGFCSDI